MNIDNTIKKIIGNKKFGGKNDLDFDGVPNRRDCQPRNTMRQDAAKIMKFYSYKSRMQEAARKNDKFELDYQMESAEVELDDGTMDKKTFATIKKLYISLSKKPFGYWLVKKGPTCKHGYITKTCPYCTGYINK